MNIEYKYGYEFKNEIKELFNKYTDKLVECDPAFAGYLTLQNYDEEINNLEYKYGLPYGRLYIVFCDGKPAGCIALKRIDDINCELKRLYVVDECRNEGIGSTLIKKLIADAKEIGYKHMLLDTFPFLTQAIHLYKKIGFYYIPIYNNNPLKTMVYMKLDL